MQVIYKKDQGQKVPVKIWGDMSSIKGKAVDQALLLSTLDMAFSHVAIMPDAHYCNGGCPVGTVFASKKYIFPTIVGADIGCGMLAWNSKIPYMEINIDETMKYLTKHIPIDRRTEDLYEWNGFKRGDLSTTGRGNHCIELNKDENNNLWILIHSGSRDFGGKIFKKHFSNAKHLYQKYHCKTPQELPFFPIESNEGHDYWVDMQEAVKFAAFNRKLMLGQFTNYLKEKFGKLDESVLDTEIDMPHNFARFENHFGENVIVHRKGSAPAQLGVLGIIPGSMTTHSYIVKGKGHSESFNSSSHGAGRVCSRKEAKQKLLEGLVPDENTQLAGKTVYGTRDYQDELGHSYKDIDMVMEHQRDLVDIVTKLTPLATYKG